MARCRAFIFPGLEAFGITPVQAQAAGRPVIAFKGGGALDYVLPGKTGIFFEEQTIDSLAQVLQSFDEHGYNPATLRAHAMRYDSSVFKQAITRYIEQADKSRLNVG
jgi:glycosyltransferase involved in cell wall biosynthesis